MTHSLDGHGLRRRTLAGASLLLLAGCGGGNTEKDEPAVAPTLTISSDTPGDATGPFTVRFTFSAAVSDFATNRILITNGALGGNAVKTRKEKAPLAEAPYNKILKRCSSQNSYGYYEKIVSDPGLRYF